MKRDWERRWLGVAVLAALALVSGETPAWAQFGTSGTGTAGGTRTGGTAGGTFGGGGTSGSTATTGGTFAGGTAGTAGTAGTGTRGTTTSTSTSGGVSASNPYKSFYITPLSTGLQPLPLVAVKAATGGGTAGGGTGGTAGGSTAGGASATIRQITSTKTFGQPLLFATTTTGGVSGTSISGGTAGISGAGISGAGISGTGTSGTGTAGGLGFATTGQVRAPAYTTELGETVPFRLAAPAAVQSEVQAVLQRSTALPSQAGISTVMDGTVVVLRGAVGTDRERRLAEGLIRMTPGVRAVRNELVVQPR